MICLLTINVSKDVMILVDGLADVSHDKDDMIGMVLPTPNAFVVRVVRLDIRLSGYAEKFFKEGKDGGCM